MSRMRLVAATLALALSGCASLGGEPLAVHGMELRPVESVGPGAPWQLLIELPRAAEPLDGVRIARRTPDGEYTVLAGVRWREPAPELLRTLLVEAFEQCGCVAGVARSSVALRADYLLESELRAFELRDAGQGTPLAHAEASFTLIRVADGRAVATQRLSHSVAAERRDASAAIAALAEALNEIVAQALAWARASVPPATASQ